MITAHGADVANARRSALLSRMTSISLARAAAVICVSRYLADRLPEAAGVPVEVIDCGVDTTVFTPAERPPGDGPRFLFVGHLNERKNVVRLLAAFEAVGRGTLTVIGAASWNMSCGPPRRRACGSWASCRRSGWRRRCGTPMSSASPAWSSRWARR